MSQACFPDPARSRALLIGASHFTAAGPDLPDIPSVQANLTALRQILTNPNTGVLTPESCRVLTDPASVDEVDTALTSQLVCPASRHQRRKSWVLALSRVNALADSQDFSAVPDV